MINILAFVIFALANITHCLPQTPIRAASGCGKTQFLPGLTQYRFGLSSAGLSRSYSYHLPSTYDKNKKYPVVIGFHGSGSIGLFFEADTKLSEARFSADKIMVYPNGIGGSWAGASYHNGSTVAQDVQFVIDLVADLEESFCVDASRVYATGVSNGGGFVDILACDEQASGLFAAFAAGSGAFYTDVTGPNNGCEPARKPLPMLEIHGGSDKSVLYDGGQGEGGNEPAIPDWLKWWSERNACMNKTEEISHDGNVHHFSWTCGGVDGLLQHYKVDSMGHCWADTEPNFSQIAVPQGPSPIQASRIIMDWFDRFSRP